MLLVSSSPMSVYMSVETHAAGRLLTEPYDGMRLFRRRPEYDPCTGRGKRDEGYDCGSASTRPVVSAILSLSTGRRSSDVVHLLDVVDAVVVVW